MHNPRKFLFSTVLAIMALTPLFVGIAFDWSLMDVVYFYLIETGVLALVLMSTNHLKQLFVFFAILLLSGVVLSLKGDSVWHNLEVPATFWGLYSVCWMIYFELSKTRLGLWVRSLHPFKHFMLYLAFMAVSVALCFSVTATVFHGWDIVMDVPPGKYVFFAVITALIPTLTIAALKIIDMIGANHVLYFLLGTYHRPVERERVIMFLDMVGSSAIAEKLTPKKSMELIAQFIFDASFVFRQCGGDILNYTGDGLIVAWPVTKAGQAIAGVEELRTRLMLGQDRYMEQFGLMPEFRIGLHAGDVVISQIGDERLFLGVYGDVVNTAQRLEKLNKNLDTTLLFSADVKQLLPRAAQNAVEDLGVQKLDGQDKQIAVFTLPRLGVENAEKSDGLADKVVPLGTVKKAVGKGQVQPAAE